ncbi:MAG TPA: hypothetical protein VMV50_02620 [Candidatus Paceibacterota bacterium]|nr:hypothetical protein [Candidatus Paceibacterota bacterium]
MRKALVCLFFFAVFLPGVSSAQGICSDRTRCSLAVDVWGVTRHQYDKNYNQKNRGLGLRAYDGRWFVAVDTMRNSVRGRATAVGVGYEYPLFDVLGTTFLVGGELAHLDYQIPGRGTVRGNLFIPGLTIRRGRVSATIGVWPHTKRNGYVLMGFLTFSLAGL